MLGDLGRLFVISSALSACSGGDGKDCPLGDLSAPPEMQLFQHVGVGEPVALQPMDSIALEQPPQGGWVFYIVPHVSNLDGCGLQLETSLIDTVSQQIVVFESRPVTLADDGTGVGVPLDVSGEGLVAACPQAMPSRDLFGVPYTLHVVATDVHGQSAEAKVDIVPMCSDPYCTCQCSASYHLGDDCSQGAP
ncbi:MAG TPA: hypothetical protein VGM90_18395 [Kofleriaceae bacterium]|jgi:hypothetical protein